MSKVPKITQIIQMYPNPILGSLESTWDRFGEKFPVFLVVQFSGNIGQHVFFQTFSIWSVPDMSVFEALRVYIRYVHGFSISIELKREGGVEGTGGNPSLQVLLVLPKRIFLARASSCRSRTAALQCSESHIRISFQWAGHFRFSMLYFRTQYIELVPLCLP